MKTWLGILTWPKTKTVDWILEIVFAEFLGWSHPFAWSTVSELPSDWYIIRHWLVAEQGHIRWISVTSSISFHSLLALSTIELIFFTLIWNRHRDWVNFHHFIENDSLSYKLHDLEAELHWNNQLLNKSILKIKSTLLNPIS